MGTTTDPRRWRLRQFAFVLAGPLANLAIAVWAFEDSGAKYQFGNLVWPPGFSIWPPLLLANALLFLNSIFGSSVQTKSGTISCDGRQLGNLLRMPAPHSETLLQTHTTIGLLMLTDDGNYLEAINVATQFLSKHPQDISVRSLLAVAQMGASDFARSRTTLLELLADYKKRDSFLALQFNNLAWADMMLDTPELWEEADRYSAEAYGLAPWLPSVQSTRGRLLIERSQFDEGTRLLRRALNGVTTRASEAAVLCSLAVAAFRQQRPDEGKRLLHRARRLDPNCELLPHAEKYSAAPAVSSQLC